MVLLEQLPHPEFLSYPSHYTAAFFRQKEKAEKALADLEASDYHLEDFNIFEGPKGVEAIDLEGTHHTVIESFMRKFIKFSDSAEWHFIEEADQELKNGAILICVPTLREAQKEEVVAAFKRHGAHDIRYFTPVYIEEIE